MVLTVLKTYSTGNNMDGLETLTSPVGPTMSAFNAGAKTTADMEAAKTQQALQAAQMQEILQRTAAAKETQPIELEAKRLGNQKTQWANKAAELDMYSGVLSRAAGQLESVPGPARYAQLNNMIQSSGLDPNNPEIAGFMEQMQRVPSEKLPAVLSQLNDRMIQQSAEMKKAIAVATIQKESHLQGVEMQGQTSRDVARITAASREAAANARNKGVQSIQDLVRSGKLTAEKAAVALHGAAQFEADPVEQQRMLQMAQQYEQFAMQQRAAQNQGKIDPGAATGLPIQTLPPTMGSNPAPVGSAANPIKLN